MITTKTFNIISTNNITGTMKRMACQNPDEEGLQECGFLVGARCIADKKNQFIVTPDFVRRLKVVGCHSYSKYMDWGFNGKQNEMSGLPFNEVAEDRRDSDYFIKEGGFGEKPDSIPMRALQESNHDRGGDSDHIGSSVSDMRRRITCLVCQKPAVAKGQDGIYLCAEHNEKRKAGRPIGVLMDDYKRLMEEKI